MNTSPFGSGWPNKTLLTKVHNVLLVILLLVRKVNCGCFYTYSMLISNSNIIGLYKFD